MATSSYSGTDFVGLDDEAFGDGQDDTQPLGTWLQHRLQSNLEYCGAEPRSLCLSPVISNADDFATVQNNRPYTHCAGDYGSVWFGVVRVHKDQTGIDVTLAYTAHTIGGTSAGDVMARVTVQDDQGALGSTSVTLTETVTTGTPDVGVVTISIEFDRAVVNARDAVLWVEVRSTISADVATTIGSTNDGVVLAGGSGHGFTFGYAFLGEDQLTTNRFWVPNDQTSVPSVDARECMYVKVTDFGIGTVDPRLDIAAVADFDAAPDGTFAMSVQTPVPNTLLVGDIGYEALLGPSFWLRALAIEPVFDDGALDIPEAKIAPNIEVGSAEAISQVQGMRALHRRRRTVSMGPRGVKNTDWPYIINAGGTDREYAVHWPFTMGNDTGDDQVLVEDSIYVQTESPELVLEMTFVHVQHETRVNLQDRVPRAKSADDKKVATPSTGDPGSADWDLTVIVDQLADVAGGGATWASNTTEYANVTKTLNLPLFPASLFFSGDSQPPIALMQEYMHKGDKGIGNEGFFHFKEGSVFGALGDGAYLISRRIRIPTSGIDTTVNARPLRVQISAAWQSTDDWLDDSPTSPESNLRLVLCSYSLFEVPGDPSRGASALIDSSAAAFGTTVAFLQETNYYAGGEDIFAMAGSRAGEGCIIGAKSAQAKIIDSAGGTTYTTTFSTGDIDQDMVAADADGFYAWSDEGAPEVRHMLPDGTAEYTLSLTGQFYGFTGSATHDGSWSFGNGYSGRTWQVDETGTASSGTYIDLGSTFYEVAVGGDDANVFFAFGDDTIQIHAITDPISATADTTVDLTTDPSVMMTAPVGSHFQMAADRVGDGVWMCDGGLLNDNQPYVLHLTADGTFDIEIDPRGDSGLAKYVSDPTDGGAVRGVAVDDYGHVYILLANSYNSPTAVDVLRYDQDGTFVYSFAADGVESDLDVESRRIAVDSEGHIYLGDIDGDVTAWSQA